MALLTQMEERALGWYPDEEPRKQALGAIAWTKLHTLRAWHDAQRNVGNRRRHAAHGVADVGEGAA